MKKLSLILALLITGTAQARTMSDGDIGYACSLIAANSARVTKLALAGKSWAQVEAMLGGPDTDPSPENQVSERVMKQAHETWAIMSPKDVRRLARAECVKQMQAYQ